MKTRVIGGLNVHPSDGIHPEFPNKKYGQTSFCFGCLCDHVCDKCMFCETVNTDIFEQFNLQMTDTEYKAHVRDESVQQIKAKVQKLITEANDIGLCIEILGNEVGFSLK